MIGITRDGNVMTLEMQREDRRNALNCELVDSLREAVEHAAAADVRAIVLTGAGNVFSSGADLTDAAGMAEKLPDKAKALKDRKSTRLNSSHPLTSRMPSSA